jgi:hypothetical protein
MKRCARVPSQLPASLHHRLNTYALAASAAGVSLLALAQPADAKIVYTSAHVKIAVNEHYGIDLDHNGTSDIYLGRGPDEGVSFLFASANPNLGNGVAVARTYREWALAIRSGATIGPARKFEGNSYFPDMATACCSGTGYKWGGPWANGGKGLKNRYLGIKFNSGGKFHYGWARVTVTIENPKINRFSSEVLTGYAYETIPNKPIIAGQTKGRDDIAERPGAALTTPEPATLGMLALGERGLSIWRREERD